MEIKKLESINKNIQVSSNEEVNFVCLEINANEKLDITLEESSNVLLSLLSKNNIDGLTINANLKKNAKLEIYFADFSFGKEKVTVNLNLDEENSSIDWHLASLSAGNDNKEFCVCATHKAKFTNCVSDNYGVCKNDGKLVFSGTSHIINGAIRSSTKQNAKIMVYDALSNGVAKPILKIDENDVMASHAAVVGKISDEHMFYLTSRGLSEATARKLITYGYLNPIVKGFSSEEVKEEILSLIEGRM